MDTLLKLLKKNARLSLEEIAVILGTSIDDVAARIEDYEKRGYIKGYTAILNDELADKDSVTAFIELKVTPAAKSGYDAIAQEICQYEEVESVYLMSGAYDLCVIIKGNNIRDISSFVSQRLAPIDSIISTSTHFMLQKYKENSILMNEDDLDERGFVSP